MKTNNKRLASRNGKGAGIRDLKAKATSSASEVEPDGLELSDEDLFDDYGLAETIVAITRKQPNAADEFTMYLLIIMRALGTDMPEQVRRTLDRSVELAFQFTSTYRAALELYTSGQRGYLTGEISAEALIREVIATMVRK
ncbi:MAG TPA: hypothetical protein VI756_02295 [Blastocatellia bacterium]